MSQVLPKGFPAIQRCLVTIYRILKSFKCSDIQFFLKKTSAAIRFNIFIEIWYQAKFTGSAIVTCIKCIIDYNSASKSGAHGQSDNRPESPGNSVGMFTENKAVYVIVNPHRQSEFRFENTF